MLNPKFLWENFDVEQIGSIAYYQYVASLHAPYERIRFFLSSFLVKRNTKSYLKFFFS
jgi:hypothetical protein